jgi:hypothetical protein
MLIYYWISYNKNPFFKSKIFLETIKAYNYRSKIKEKGLVVEFVWRGAHSATMRRLPGGEPAEFEREGLVGYLRLFWFGKFIEPR